MRSAYARIAACWSSATRRRSVGRWTRGRPIPMARRGGIPSSYARSPPLRKGARFGLVRFGASPARPPAPARRSDRRASAARGRPVGSCPHTLHRIPRRLEPLRYNPRALQRPVSARPRLVHVLRQRGLKRSRASECMTWATTPFRGFASRESLHFVRHRFQQAYSCAGRRRRSPWHRVQHVGRPPQRFRGRRAKGPQTARRSPCCCRVERR